MEKIKQAEGLCLMYYQCKKCGVRERLWNSRPRVTPFGISCAACKGHMLHVDWNRDEYAPNHRPSIGERIFIDWSKEAAEKHYYELVEKNWEHPEYPLSTTHPSKEEAVKSLMETWKS